MSPQNIFSIVRSKNGFNDRPEYTAFRSAIRAVALSNLLKPISTSANCEMDQDGLLVDVLDEASGSAACKQGISAPLDQDCALDETNDDTTDDDDDSNLQRSESEVVDYIGGYIITRLAHQKKLKCDSCRDDLIRHNQRGVLIQEKDFVKDFTRKGALAASSPSLLAFLTTAESVARQHLKDSSHVDNIGSTIREAIIKQAPRLECCHSFDAASLVSTLFLRVRLHHHSRLTNENLRTGRRSLSKSKKLSKLGVSH